MEGDEGRRRQFALDSKSKGKQGIRIKRGSTDTGISSKTE